MIILAGDFHIGLKSYVLRKGVDSRFYDIKKRLNYLGSYCIKNKATHLIVAGDTFEFSHPSPQAYSLAISFYKGLIRKGIEVYVLSGNHDQTVYTSALQPFKKIDGINVIDGKEVEFKVIEGQLFAFAPWLVEMEDMEVTKCDVLITHADDGTFPDRNTLSFPFRKLRYKIAFAGHIHTPDYIKEHKLYHVSSLTPRTFGEVSCGHGFLMYDFDEPSFIECTVGLKYGEVEILDNRKYKDYEEEINQYDEVKLKIHLKTLPNINEIIKYYSAVDMVIRKWEYVSEEKDSKSNLSGYMPPDALNPCQALEVWLKTQTLPCFSPIFRLGMDIIKKVDE